MFSVKQKRDIADKVQRILRETNHPELPQGEIEFELRVAGSEDWSWAEIRNNGSITSPDVNPWNEKQAGVAGKQDMILTCRDLPSGVSCCLSCHEDYEEYGYDLCERDKEHNGFDGQFCCAMLPWVDEHLEECKKIWASLDAGPCPEKEGE